MEYSEWHLLNVYLDLNELGLGMSIRGGVDSADGQGNTDVYISKILEGGAVQQDGRLRIGKWGDGGGGGGGDVQLY